jgi:hypothetical protein
VLFQLLPSPSLFLDVPLHVYTIKTFSTAINQSFFLIGIVEGGVQLGPLSTAATNRPIVPALGYYDGENG